MNVCWKISVDCLQLTHPQSGVAVRIVAETVSEERWIIGCYGSEPVAQGVVENDIPRGAKGQEAGGIFAAVAHLGEIPIGGAFAFDVIDTRRVGEAQNQVAGSVDDFDARSKNEIGRSGNTEESGDDVIFIVHEIGSVRVDLIAEGNVHDAAVVGDVVKFVALNHDGGQQGRFGWRNSSAGREDESLPGTFLQTHCCRDRRSCPRYKIPQRDQVTQPPD